MNEVIKGKIGGVDNQIFGGGGRIGCRGQEIVSYFQEKPNMSGSSRASGSQRLKKGLKKNSKPCRPKGVRGEDGKAGDRISP